MFSLTIRLRYQRFYNFEAIDLCRRLGLPEKTQIDTGNGVSVDVDEKFARAFFYPDIKGGRKLILTG